MEERIRYFCKYCIFRQKKTEHGIVPVKGTWCVKRAEYIQRKSVCEKFISR